MIVILLAIVGATLGWRIATKRDGNRLDKLQYAAALMLGFSVIGLFITLIIDILI
ncbi:MULTISPECIES: apolipoprotein acyltransferase [Pacificibacter]|uniref:apolipoprotein acyltransferase n=1 Tax=Pacificibacter TaxID=1042323 RepID=UPI001C08F51F|nr:MULTISPECIES: apolipoprotein acyltransferase [Pacificibacter]MBU2936260.1 apolipoprotein acyltransferase [Pacificibacter marinus]MDO6616729.1 apolipoprotein acyltransferase [Pacificibacter sp. 1_MG-2023]